MNKKNCFLRAFFFIFCTVNSFSNPVPHVQLQQDKLPHIENLSSKDILFEQYSEEVEQSYIRAAKHQSPALSFFTYTAGKNDTLLTVASRCSLPYETIATLNSIENQAVPLQNKKLLLPTVPGIFINSKPELPYEMLLYQKFDSMLLEQNNVICYNFGDKELYFFECERFSSTERAFFLDSSLRMPLKHCQLSSAFGMRTSPISGKWLFHKGIDLAAPEGTDVFACQSASVSVCGYNDAVYGNYIILDHGNGMTSVYAHLSAVMVKKGETVYGGRLIGKVGRTGMATGPHLHFEMRLQNIPSDPQKLIQK